MILIAMTILVATNTLGTWEINNTGDAIVLIGLIMITLLGDLARIKTLFR